MAIKGLMESRGRLPVLGRIRLGVKAVTARGQEYPKEVKYFVLPPELVPVVGQEQPTELRVRFPTAKLEALCDAWYLRYDSGKLGRRCDGVTFEEIKEVGAPQTGECLKPPRGPCPCRATANARLSVIIDGGPVGVYWVLLGGEQRIADLLSALDFHAKMLAGHGCTLTQFPWILARVPAQEGFVKDGKRAKREGYPVQLRALYTWADLARNGAAALPAGQPAAALTGEVAPTEVDEEPEHHDEPIGDGEPEIAGAHVEAEEAEITAHAPETGGRLDGPARAPQPAETPAPPTTPVAPPPGIPPATEAALLAAAERVGLGPGTLWQFVKAKYPALTEAGKPGVYGVLVEQMAQAAAGGESAIGRFKGECFKAMREAAKGGR